MAMSEEKGEPDIIKLAQKDINEGVYLKVIDVKNDVTLHEINQSEIKMTDDIKEPPVLLRVGDSAVCTMGNISTIIGKAKSRKTFVTTAIAAAYLKRGRCLGFEAWLPDDKQKVIIFDTEQGRHHVHRVLRRTVLLASLPLDTHPENLKVYSLRRHDPKKRLDIIEKVLYSEENVGAVILDGVRDVLFDINSAEESITVVSKLMKWSEELMCHIINVLHQNKADTYARGHLGTEMVNKSESVLEVKKEEQSGEVSVVSANMIRDREFEPFAFGIDAEGLPQMADHDPVEEKGRKDGHNPGHISEKYHIAILQAIFAKGHDKTTRELIVEVSRQAKSLDLGVGQNKAREYIKFYVDNNLLENTGSEFKKNFRVTRYFLEHYSKRI